MLASLLPGLRDLRTPLAVGYLWLFVVWLLVHDLVPTKQADATGPFQSIFQLETFVGASAMLATLTFIAYILGALLTIRLPWNYFEASPIRLTDDIPSMWRRVTYAVPAILSLVYLQSVAQFETQLRGVVVDKLRRSRREVGLSDHIRIIQDFEESLTSWARKNYDQDYDRSFDAEDAYLRAISMQFPTVAIQLQAKNRDLWDSFDRARAESEFRSGIAWPLLLIILIVGWQASYWWWLLIAIPIALLVRAMGKSIEATATLIQAVVLGLVEPPIFDRINEVVGKSKAEEERFAKTSDRMAKEDRMRLRTIRLHKPRHKPLAFAVQEVMREEDERRIRAFVSRDPAASKPELS